MNLNDEWEYITPSQRYNAEIVSGEVFTIGRYNYRVSVHPNGRFTIHIEDRLNGKAYYLAGDKKTKFDIHALITQIENVVKNNAPNNKRIRDIIDRYWPTMKWKTKHIQNEKKDLSGMPD